MNNRRESAYGSNYRNDSVKTATLFNNSMIATTSSFSWQRDYYIFVFVISSSNYKFSLAAVERRKKNKVVLYKLFNSHGEGTNKRNTVNSISFLFCFCYSESESHAWPKFQMFTILTSSECCTFILCPTLNPGNRDFGFYSALTSQMYVIRIVTTFVEF